MRKRRAKRPGQHSIGDYPDGWAPREEIWRREKKEIIKTNAFITFGFILFIILIADKLGFFLTILIFTFVTPLLWQRKDKFFVLLYSIGMTLFVFVFFTLVLQLKFPQGILEDFIVRNFY